VFSWNWFHDMGAGNNLSYGIYPSGNTHRLRVIGNRFENMQAGGVQVIGVDQQTRDLVVTGNTFDTIGTGGGPGVQVQAMLNVRISDNLFKTAYAGGVSIVGDTREYLIGSNTFDFTGITDALGVSINGGNQNGRVESNVFTAPGRVKGAAVSIYSGNNISLARNTILNIKQPFRLRHGPGGSYGTNVRIDSNMATLDPNAPDLTPGDGNVLAGIYIEAGSVMSTVYPNSWVGYTYDTYRP
jgi:hypothetical protein